MKIDVCFIILNYKNLNETINCVSSIRSKLKNKKYRIIIADNGSQEKELNKLKEKYKKIKEVTILAFRKNLGFSKGNNLGCEYAIKKFKPKFLFVINSDIRIIQENTIEILKKEYKKSKFEVMGPDILTPSGKHQNPYLQKEYGLKEINKLIFKTYILFFLSFLFLDEILFKIYSKIKEKFLKRKGKNKGQRQENVSLHGSALIFSERYYKKYRKIFYPEVFLYCEEIILNYKRTKDHLKFVYNPELKVLHREHKTMDKIYPKIKKRKAKYKYSISSLKEFKKFIKNGQKFI